MLRRNYLSVSSGEFMGAIEAIFNHSVGFWKAFQFSDVKIKKIKLVEQQGFLLLLSSFVCFYLIVLKKEKQCLESWGNGPFNPYACLSWEILYV